MKRVLLFLLVVGLVLVCLPMSLFAATGSIPEIAKVLPVAFGDYLGSAAVDPEQTRPGDEILIPLLKKGFEDETGALIVWDPAKPDMGPTVGQLRANRIVPYIQVMKGRDYIRDVELVKFTPTSRIEAYAAIRIRFIPEYISTKEFEYEFKILVAQDGKPCPDVHDTFGGRFSNPVFSVDDPFVKWDYIDITDGTVVKANVSAVEVKLKLADGVFAIADIANGEKYYATAKAFENDPKVDDIMDQYPEIKETYQITSVGLKASHTKIQFTGYDANNKYFVYNVAGELVGTSDKPVPYSHRYYLTSKEIEIDPELITYDFTEKDDTYVMSEDLKGFWGGLVEDQKENGVPQ